MIQDRGLHHLPASELASTPSELSYGPQRASILIRCRLEDPEKSSGRLAALFDKLLEPDLDVSIEGANGLDTSARSSYPVHAAGRG